MAQVSATGLCGAGNATEVPCDHPASTVVLGVPFCDPHAREQEARFAMGELAQAYGVLSDWEKEARRLGNKPLLETLARMEWELDARLAEERARLRGAP